MKGRTFFIIGGILVAGVIAYEIYKHFSKPMGKIYSEKRFPSDDTSAANDVPKSEAAGNHSSTADEVYKTKATATVVHSVRGRHVEAARAMEESLNTIFKETDDGVATENSELLETTSKELDDLLN
jgi:hypothetical protein